MKYAVCTPILCMCERMKALARLHACSGASEHCLIAYAICTVFEPAHAMFVLIAFA